MAFPSGASTSRFRPEESGDGEWSDQEKPRRDWKKRALVIGLGTLSWVATYVGMLELIEANMGSLPLAHRIIIGFSVAMLMTMVVWLLDEMFKPQPFVVRLLYLFGYLFLTVISVGFGFGFYWKVLESRSEASRSAESAVTQVQSSLVAASTRLDQLQATLDQLTAVSKSKAETERASGTSCPNSKPGDGPRRKLREDDAARFAFAADFVKGRATSVKSEMSALDVDLAKITSDDKSIIDPKSGTRNLFMQGLERKLDGTVTGFNAFRTDPQLKQIRTDLADRAEKVTFPDTQGKAYSCPDPQLQTALRGVTRAIDQLPELEKPKIAAVEGSEATIEAFRRLTATFYGLLSFKLPPSADELRDLQKKAIQSVEAPSSSAAVAARHALAEQPGLSKRDYVPLAIALFVDLCLLLVSMGKSHDRLEGLVPKMRAAERGPVIQILSRFNEIHRDRQIRENFELFRHVVFDFHGDYYVAVPLDAPRRLNPREREELRVETQLLSNLFAGFEKEKIFTRVFSPFLTTGVVRKRLARQGSKFALSDAFRLYRFKDGAWSDIILGAVMGAARRVEAEKRTLAVQADQQDRTAAAALAAGYQQAGYAPGGPPPFDHVFTRPTHRSQPARTGERARPDPELAERFGAYAPFVAEPMLPPAGNVHPFPGRTQTGEPQWSPVAPPPTAFMEPTYAPGGLAAANSNTGPAVQPAPAYDLRPPILPAAPATVPEPILVPAAPVAEVLPFQAPAQPRPAQGQLPPRNPSLLAEADAAPAPDVDPATVALGPSLTVETARDAQRQVGVVMTRVTESMTVPVSEAALPLGFLAATRRSDLTLKPETPVLPPPLPAASADHDRTLTEFARRFARQPGE